MAKRSGKSKGPKAEQLRKVGEKAKRGGGSRLKLKVGDWVVAIVGASGVRLPALVVALEFSGGDFYHPPRVRLTWPNEHANNAADKRGKWNNPAWVPMASVEAAGLESMTDTVLRHLAGVIELRGMPESADPTVHGVAVWREMAKRGLKTPEDQKDDRGEPGEGEDDQAGGDAEPAQGDRTVGGKILERAVSAVAQCGRPRDDDGAEDEEDGDTVTLSVDGGPSVTTTQAGLRRTVEALEAKAEGGRVEGTKPGSTVHVEFDRPIGRLVGEHAELVGVRLLHQRGIEGAWALASTGAVMAAVPVTMLMPEDGVAPREADVVPGDAARGTPGKPRVLELRWGRPQGLFDSGMAWVCSGENRWWGTWAPDKPCNLAAALPEVDPKGSTVRAVKLDAGKLAELAKVLGDANGCVTLLLDAAALVATDDGDAEGKPRARVAVVGDDDSGTGAGVGVLVMDVEGPGACKRYAESRERLLRLSRAPRNQLIGKV